MLINEIIVTLLMTSGFSTTTNIRGEDLSMNLMSNYAAWMHFCIDLISIPLVLTPREDVKLASPSV